MPAPTRVKSRGPNGTHWPASATCPWKGDTIPNQVTVAANWADIKAAVNGFSAAEVAAGAVVWVKPGVLVGNGAASGSVAAAEKIGSSSWTRSVLIYPRDGYGTVTSSTGMRIDAAARIALFGIKSSAAIVFTNFDHVQLGWSKYVQGPNMNTSGKYYEFWEIVNGDVRSNEDVSAVRPSGTNTIRYGKHSGCLFQPAIKAAGSDAHLDTHQSERTGTGGQYGDLEFEDSTYYSSSNGAFITSSTNGMTWRNCSIIALEIWQRVYPLRTGDYKTPAGKSLPNAINGGATNVRLYDTDVVGSIGSVNYSHLENTRVHYQPQASQQASDGTKWIAAPEMANWTREQMLARCPLPTDEYLDSIWNKGQIPPSVPDPGNPGTGNPNPETDTVKPAATITYPATGGSLSGVETVKITATDNVGVTGVSLWSGSVQLPGTFTRTTGDVWEASFDSTGYPDGVYPIEPHALDAAGNESIGRTVYVTILNNGDGGTPDEERPSVFSIRLVSQGPGTISIDWGASYDRTGQPITYRPFLDGEIAGPAQETTSFVYSKVPSSPGVMLRVDATDPDGNVRSSNELVVRTSGQQPPQPPQPPITPPGVVVVRPVAVPDGRPAPYVDLTVTGVPARAATATLFRKADGRLYKVRGFVKKSKFGVLAGRDFEAPLGREAVYYAEFYDLGGRVVYTTPEAAVTLPSDLRRSALVHGVLDPTGSVALTLASSALAVLSRSAALTSVTLPSRSAPAVLGGVRGGLSGLSIDAYTATPQDTAKLWALLGGYDVASAAVLCVRLSPDAPLPGTLYLTVSAPEARPLNAQQGGSDTLWSLTADEVAPPTPALVVPVLTYADFTRALRDYGENYADFAAAYASYRAATRDTKVGPWE